MLISTALADTATSAANGQGSMLTSFAPLIFIIVIFYFLLIRPQQKKMKEHQSAINSIKKGTKVVTAGGIFATVVKVEDKEDVLFVEIAQNTRIKVKKSTITEVLISSEEIDKTEKKEAKTTSDKKKPKKATKTTLDEGSKKESSNS